MDKRSGQSNEQHDGQGSSSKAEAVLAQAVRESPAIVAVLRGPTHRLEMVNPAFGRISANRDVVGKAAADALPEIVTPELLLLLDRARAGEAIVVDEAAVWLRSQPTGEPRERFFTLTLSPLEGTAEAGAGVLVTAFELTEGVQARRRAEAERARLQQVIEASPEAIALANAHGQIILANTAATTIWGGPPADASVDGYADAYGTYHLDGTPYPARELPLARSILHGEIVRDARLYIRNRATGRMIPVLINSAPLYDAAGQIDGGVVVFQDISSAHELQTAREEASATAAARAAELEAVLSGMGEAAIVYDGAWRVLLANGAARALFRWEGPVEGLRVDELVERVRADLGDDRAKLALISTQASQLAESGEAMELRFVHPPRVVIRRSSTIRKPDNSALAHIVLFQDVTAERVAAQEKDDFLSVTSHELKTPLTSLRGMAQVAQRRLARNDTRGALESLDVVLTQARRLERLINDLLDVSRIQGDHLVLTRAPLDLVELARAAVQRHEAAAEGHRLHLHTSQGPLTVEGDAGRLDQVLDNLLSNAIKYSPGGGDVDVLCSRESGSAVVRVRDRGIGVDLESRGRLFERFYRSQNASVQYFAGMGVGLWISRQILERHGGRLWLESTGAEGSVFAFSLPLMDGE